MGYGGNQITWGRLAQSLKNIITNAKNALTTHEGVKASTDTLGHIKPDGTTITVDESGVASAVIPEIPDKTIPVYECTLDATEADQYNVTIPDFDHTKQNVFIVKNISAANKGYPRLKINNLASAYIVATGSSSLLPPATFRRNGELLIVTNQNSATVDVKAFNLTAPEPKTVWLNSTQTNPAISLWSGWEASGTVAGYARVRRIGDVVTVQMSGVKALSGNTVIVATLAEGFRPAQNVHGICYIDGIAKYINFYISSGNGYIMIESVTGATNNYLSLNIMFVTQEIFPSDKAS